MKNCVRHIKRFRKMLSSQAAACVAAATDFKAEGNARLAAGDARGAASQYKQGVKRVLGRGGSPEAREILQVALN